MRIKFFVVAGILAITSCTVFAQKQVLVTNVIIFNGKDNKVSPGHVLIIGNQITKISATPIPVNKSANSTIIDGKESF